MSDYFAPPADDQHRHRPPLCRALGPEGERCDLYRDHEARFHRFKDQRWPVEPA